MSPEELARHAVANAELAGTVFDEEWKQTLLELAAGRTRADDLVAEAIAKLGQCDDQ